MLLIQKVSVKVWFKHVDYPLGLCRCTSVENLFSLLLNAIHRMWVGETPPSLNQHMPGGTNCNLPSCSANALIGLLPLKRNAPGCPKSPLLDKAAVRCRFNPGQPQEHCILGVVCAFYFLYKPQTIFVQFLYAFRAPSQHNQRGQQQNHQPGGEIAGSNWKRCHNKMVMQRFGIKPKIQRKSN